MKIGFRLGLYKGMFRRLLQAFSARRLLLAYVVSYLAVLGIPVMIGSLFYQETIVTLEQSLINTQQKAITTTRQRIDQRFAEIEAITSQLALNSNIIALQTVANPINKGKTVVAFNTVQKELQSLKAANQFVDSFIVYFQKSNAIMTQETVYLRLDDVYGKLINFAGLDYPGWQQEILLNTFNRNILAARQIRLGSRDNRCLIYARSIPLNAGYGNNGNILVLIDEKQLQQMMDGLQFEDGGWVSITDNEDNVLLNYAPGQADIHAVPDIDGQTAQDSENGPDSGFHEQDIGGRTMLVFRDRSPSTGWLYTVVVSKDFVMNRVNQIRNLLLYVLVAIILLGILLAFLLAYRNFVPLRNVIRLLSDQSGDPLQTGSPASISQAVARLIDHDRNLQVAVERQKPMLRTATLDNLLHGYSSSDEQLALTMQMLDLRIGPCAIVAILRIEGYGEPGASSLPHLNVASAILREAVLKALGETDYLIDTNMQEILMILSLNSTEPNVVRSRVVSVVRSINECADISITIAAGDAVGRLLDLPRSYHQAQDVLDASLAVKTSHIIWYSEHLQNNHVYLYRPETELQIINLVKGANSEELERILDSLYNDNIVNRVLSPQIARVWLFDLCGTLVKLINQVPVDSQIVASINEMARELGTRKTRDEFAILRGLLLQICLEQNINKHSRLQNMISGIRDYIYRNSAESWLDLNHISDHFGISPAYLSQLYREITGINFSDDLENYRMNKARELLACTDLSVEAIALKTGYQSATAFRRAFKRLQGMTPTEYKSGNPVRD